MYTPPIKCRKKRDSFCSQTLLRDDRRFIL